MTDQRLPPNLLSPPRDATPPSVLGLLTVFLRQRKWFLLGMFATVIITVAIRYPRGLTYTSETSFFPEAARTATSAAAGIAAQFGVNVGQSAGASATTSPQFYPELIRAPQFLQDVVETPLEFAPGQPKQTLIEIYGIKSPDPRARRAAAADILNQSLYANVTPQTGIVKVSATSTDPLLAYAIAQTVLAKIGEFNVKSRQGRATAERHFLEKRMAEVGAELRAAEDRLESFQNQNRDSRSPNVQFLRARLEREVTLRAQLYAVLAQSYEQARMDEVRDTPVIAILSRPEPPVLPNPRGRVRLAILALMGGVVFGIVCVFIADQFSSAGTEREPHAAEFHERLAEIKSDLKAGRFRLAFFGP